MVTIAGWHRDHARKMLRQAAAGELPGPHTPRERMLRYGQEVTDALVRCWVLLDGIASKCLAPAISRAGRPRPARHDRGHQGPLLLTMSPTTMDRHLKPYLQGLLVPARTIHTKPGSLLKSSIPMKTWATTASSTTASTLPISLRWKVDDVLEAGHAVIGGAAG